MTPKEQASVLRFDDREALQARVSEAFGEFGEPLVISQEMIERFAELTGDRQWIHVDTERAARHSPQRSTIAHGLLVASLLPALCQEQGFESTGHASILSYGYDELRFSDPVLSGSTIHARSRLVHVRKKGPNGTQLTFAHEIWALDARKPALRCRALVVYLG